jgi:hypothetical protein
VIKICIVVKLLAVKPRRPMTPDALRIEEAISRSTPLARLQHLLKESQARLAVVRSVVPPALGPHLKPGPIDEAGWTLLVANASVAAKVRQLLPRLEDALRARGMQVTAIRIRVQ